MENVCGTNKKHLKDAKASFPGKQFQSALEEGSGSGSSCKTISIMVELKVGSMPHTEMTV